MAELANYVKFLRGTPEAYAQATKDNNTLYFVTGINQKVGKLYLGDILVAGNITSDGTSVVDSLRELTDVNLEGLETGKVLGYNGTEWVPMDLPEACACSVMVGASADEAGSAGYVPAPQSGDQNKFLRGDGTWADIKTSSNTQIFEIDIEKGADHQEAIATAVGEAVLQNGDIAIVKELIIADNRQYTAYVYNNGWVAMDGNYSITDIYTNEDITVTTAVGELAVNEIIKAGTNVGDLLVSMLSQSKDPEIVTNPSITFSITNGGSGTSFEAGTTITPKWNSTFNSGSYSYKSTVSKDNIVPVDGTGVTATAWSIKLGETEIGTTEDGTASEVVLGDSNLTYTATATYSDGNYALTNLNKLPETDVQIKGSSVSSSGATISTYRKMYAGAIDKDATIDNTTIRALLTSSGKKASTNAYEFTANTGDEKLIFAYPKSLSSKAPKFEYFTMSWESFDGFIALENVVQVADKRGEENGLADYVVYVYEPASAFKTDTNYKVSF